MELEDFSKNCLSEICLKHQRYDSKTCIRKSKQFNCFKSYQRNIVKKGQNYLDNQSLWEEQNEFNDLVWIRDSGVKKGDSSTRKNWKGFCRIWKILSQEEKNYLEQDPDIYLNSKLEIAHIKARSVAPDRIKDISNVVLIGSLFHRRLTDLIHPVYKTPITNIEAEKILIKALNGK